MVDIHYSIVCLICAINLSIILFQHIKCYYKSEYKRSFIVLTSITLVFVIVDILWGLICSGLILSNNWIFPVSTIYHFCASFVAFTFASFIVHFCREKINHIKIVYTILALPLLVSFSVLIRNIFVHEVFFINANGFYCRGNQKLIDILYFMHYLYFLFAMLVALYSYINANKKNEHFSRSVIFCTLIPIVSAFLQYKTAVIPYGSMGFSLACFLIYSFENSYAQTQMVKQSMDNKLRSILEECTFLVQSEKLPAKNIERMLQYIVNYYDAVDAYVVEFEEETFDARNVYCWTKSKNPRHEKINVNSIPKNWIAEWSEVYKFKTELYIPDVQTPGLLKSYVNFAKLFHIKSLMTTPIIFNGKLRGIISVYDMKNLKNDFTVLRTVSAFIFTEIIKRNIFEETQKERESVIAALSNDYDCIYYIDLDNDKITLYRHDEKVMRFFDIRDKETIAFATSYKLYVENFVVPEDQIELLEFGSVEVLKTVLRERKSVTKKFRSNISGNTDFFEAKWVKVENENEEPKFVVLGYTNIQDKIQQKMIEEKKLENVQAQLNSAIEIAETVSYESQLDKLTGIYNKYSGLEIMKKYLNAKPESEEYGLLFFDLDKFKEINDSFGHLEGDQILVGIGNVIKNKCRAGDIAVRFGGDEFVLLLKNISEISQLKNKAQQLSDGINKLGIGKFYYTTCSIGGIVSASRDLQYVIDNADKSLYFVKENGRDGIKICKDKN